MTNFMKLLSKFILPLSAVIFTVGLNTANAQYFPSFPAAPIDTITQPTQTYVNLANARLADGVDDTTSLEDISARLTVSPRASYMNDIKDAYLSSLRKENPADAAKVAEFLNGFDIEKAYLEFASQTGFEPNNVGHTLGAFNLIGWLISNQQYSAARDGKYIPYYPGMRNAYSVALYQRADEISVGEFRRMDAEMKFYFVLLANFAAEIYRSGDQDAAARHAKSVNAFWMRNYGFDMTKMKMTKNGLRPA